MKIVVAGYGVEGASNYTYFSALGHDVVIADENPTAVVPEGAEAMLGIDALTNIDADMVVRSAGIAPHKISTRGTMWSATNEFFAQCPARIIGVTGTKGKGTTVSWIASILRHAGHTVHVVGNIGVPALDVLPLVKPEDIVVYELSSFQLWDIQYSPHTAVVLMIEADHLDVHANMAEYVAAKAGITRHQTTDDTCVYHPTNELSKQIADKSQGKKLRYGTSEDGGVYVKSNTFFVQDTPICGTDAVVLPGVHNLENACAAMTACLEYVDDYEMFETGLREFKGLDHRLKFVAEVDGVGYYDDSIATTPGSAMAALDSFGQPSVLIVGGKDKGGDYSELLSKCAQTSTPMVLIGETKTKIAELAHQYSVTHVEATTMKDAVAKATNLAAGRGVVILSPAASSFDEYKNYQDRGQQFIDAVYHLRGLA